MVFSSFWCLRDVFFLLLCFVCFLFLLCFVLFSRAVLYGVVRVCEGCEGMFVSGVCDSVYACVRVKTD